MRIAFSGAHRVGKTTLLEAVAEALPGSVTVDEPYVSLEEEGYLFAHPPALEDFEAQLERSLASFEEPHPKALFDRTPVDFLAYLACHPDGDAFDAEPHLPRVARALSTLDLVVFVAIEPRDRIRLANDAARRSRLAVDEHLHELWIDDPHGFGVEVLTVEGDEAERAKSVLSRLRRIVSVDRSRR